MTSADSSQPAPEINAEIDPAAPLLDFPCVFPIKVMGEHADTFPALVLQLIKTHQPQFEPADLHPRLSSGGRYISLTCEVEVHSQAQLDAIYRALSTHPLVKYVL